MLYNFFSLSKSLKSNLEFIFLKIIINIIPIPYSKPANPNKKILEDSNVKSSFIAPETKT